LTSGTYGIIEFDDGTYAAVMRLRLGYNTDQRPSNTWMMTRDCYRIIAKEGFRFRVFTSTEVYRDSESAKYLMMQLSSIRDLKLRNVQRRIIQGVLDNASARSNVPIVHVFIYARTQIQKEELPIILRRLEIHFGQAYTCIRDLKVLNNEEIVGFLRNYYALEVLDMSTLRVRAAEENIGGGTSFEILKLYDTDGDEHVLTTFNRKKEDMIIATKLRRVAK